MENINKNISKKRLWKSLTRKPVLTALPLL
jgi:hypothetical protein